MKLCLSLLATICLVAILLGGVAASAADVSGKWTGEVQGQDGQNITITFTLKADGEKLTGKLSGPMDQDIDIADGKVNGDEISFSITMNFNDNQFTLHYTGKVTGDEMKLKMESEDGNFSQEMTLKRAAS